ncbi:MAG: hypothetical protein O3A63_10960 [Proteobacteria bacterium]|nr:hypothetical protein [Pseudomonadota bacterium]
MFWFRTVVWFALLSLCGQAAGTEIFNPYHTEFAAVNRVDSSAPPSPTQGNATFESVQGSPDPLITETSANPKAFFADPATLGLFTIGIVSLIVLRRLTRY